MSKVTGTWYRDKARELREVTREIEVMRTFRQTNKKIDQALLFIDITQEISRSFSKMQGIIVENTEAFKEIAKIRSMIEGLKIKPV